MTIKGIATEGAAPLSMDAEQQDARPGLLIDCTIIEGDRWGSSGYYPGSALEKTHGVFVKGTQTFLDHAEVGEDSGAKLLGRLDADARFVTEDGVPKIKAPIYFYETGVYNAAWVKERIEDLGLSIRAGVAYENGTAPDGRKGKIVEGFTSAISVDVVTRAGAGGKFGSIKESEHVAQTIEEEEGANVPLSKEEIAEIATTVAAGVVEGLKPGFSALETAVKESAKAPKEKLGAAQVHEKIAEAKLGKGASARVWAAYESETEDVADVLATESAIRQEYLRENEKVVDGKIVVEADKPNGDETAVEKALPAGWGVTKTAEEQS